jgi:hypothetical protein
MIKEIKWTVRQRLPPNQLLRRRLVRAVTLLPALLVLPVSLTAPASADTGNGYLVDHGVAIYYAIIPAEMILGHAEGHPEAMMHGGVPERPHTHHLMVALFDAKSLDRIVDAKVTATVGEIGLASETKELQPFTVAEALTYGNYFEMPPRRDYLVRVDVKTPRPGPASSVRFEFKH